MQEYKMCSSRKSSSVPAAVDLTLDDIRRGFETKAFTSADLVQVHLSRIVEVNDRIKAVVEIDPTALEQAKILNSERENGRVRGYFKIYDINGNLADSTGLGHCME